MEGNVAAYDEFPEDIDMDGPVDASIDIDGDDSPDVDASPTPVEFRVIEAQIPEQMAEAIPAERAVGPPQPALRMFGVLLCRCRHCEENARPNWTTNFNIFLADVLTDAATVHAMIAAQINFRSPRLAGWHFAVTQQVAMNEVLFYELDHFEVCFGMQPVVCSEKPFGIVVTTDPDSATGSPGAPTTVPSASATSPSSSSSTSGGRTPASCYHGVAAMLTSLRGQVADAHLTEAGSMLRVSNKMQWSPRLTRAALDEALGANTSSLHLSLGSYPSSAEMRGLARFLVGKGATVGGSLHLLVLTTTVADRFSDADMQYLLASSGVPFLLVWTPKAGAPGVTSRPVNTKSMLLFVQEFYTALALGASFLSAYSLAFGALTAANLPATIHPTLLAITKCAKNTYYPPPDGSKSVSHVDDLPFPAVGQGWPRDLPTEAGALGELCLARRSLAAYEREVARRIWGITVEKDGPIVLAFVQGIHDATLGQFDRLYPPETSRAERFINLQLLRGQFGIKMDPKQVEAYDADRIRMLAV